MSEDSNDNVYYIGPPDFDEDEDDYYMSPAEPFPPIQPTPEPERYPRVAHGIRQIVIAAMLIVVIVWCLAAFATQQYHTGYTNGSRDGASEAYKAGHNAGLNDGYADGNKQGKLEAMVEFQQWQHEAGCKVDSGGYAQVKMWRDASGQYQYSCVLGGTK